MSVKVKVRVKVLREQDAYPFCHHKNPPGKGLMQIGRLRNFHLHSHLHFFPPSLPTFTFTVTLPFTSDLPFQSPPHFRLSYTHLLASNHRSVFTMPCSMVWLAFQSVAWIFAVSRKMKGLSPIQPRSPPV